MIFNIYGGRSHEYKSAWVQESHDGALGGSGLSRGKGSNVRLQGGLWGPSGRPVNLASPNASQDGLTWLAVKSQGLGARVCMFLCTLNMFYKRFPDT